MDIHELQKISGSYTAARTLQVACDLKLFDVLASESRTSKGIADALKTDPRATELLCNALAGMELLEKRGGHFTNTEVSQKYLVTSAPLYYGWIIRHASRLWEGWGRLEESVRSGKPLKWKDSSERTDEETETFIMGMHSIIVVRGDADLMAEKLDLEKVGKILDLGGGPATFSIVFCERFKDLEATVFDLPETIKIARRNLSRYPDVSDRIDLVEGDFLTDNLPGGFDLVLVSNIIHMCNEGQNEALMNKVFKSLNSGGRVIVKDHILNDDLTKPPFAAIFSLNMLLHADGRDYSASEIKGWLTNAGFSKTDTIDLPDETPYGVVFGIK